VHPVGFIYEDYTGMHGQQNIKVVEVQNLTLR